mgnify:FL=1
MATCARCGTRFGPRSGHQFHGPDGAIVKCRGCALAHGPLLRRSLQIALLVGTILVAINQGDLLLHGQWHPALVWKVPFTYAVPFVVATWSGLIASRV